MSYDIEMLWSCSICRHSGNRGLKDRCCCNCGHKKDPTDPEYMPDDRSEAAALTGEDARKAGAGRDWICKFCESVQNQLNKCCGNCGGERDGTHLVSPLQAERIGAEVREDFQEALRETRENARQLDEYSERNARGTAPPAWSSEQGRQRPRRWGIPAVALGLAGLIWLLVWLFSPHVVTTHVSQLDWRHDTIIERYQVQSREGWYPDSGSFQVVPLGMRHHHDDRVHVGSHREPYSERYACGENCTSIPTTTTCSSNGNGTARCTKSGGGQRCSTKYCNRTAYRTVQDYQNVPRYQLWFAWRVWAWGYNRTVTRSGHKGEPVWPLEEDLRPIALATGEQERSSRSASYKVTFQELNDSDTYNVEPKNIDDFRRFSNAGDNVFRLKVTRVGSVEVLP